MYLHNDSAAPGLQPVASGKESVASGKVVNLRPTRSEASQPAPNSQEGLDPLGAQVFDFAKKWLSEHSEKLLTVKDLTEGLEDLGMQVGDSAIRERLNRIVEQDKLECIPGSGRRPAYYQLPGQGSKVTNSADEDESCIAQLSEVITDLIEEISSIESVLTHKKQELEELKSNRKVLEEAMRIKQKLRDLTRS